MSKKKPNPIAQPFESTKAKDSFVKIYHEMRLSPAWLALTAKQRDLYGCCKDHCFRAKDRPNGNERQFYMPRFQWQNVYSLYTSGSNNGFIRDMSALIEKGFVRCVMSGATAREKSVYEFSDKWQLYGTAAFKIELNEMNSSLRRKYKAEKAECENAPARDANEIETGRARVIPFEELQRAR